MPSPADVNLAAVSNFPRSAPGAATDPDAQLCELLKRCSPRTIEAARRFRQTGDLAQLPVIVVGVVERFADREQRTQLAGPSDHLRLAEDLGIDSLTMMEIVMLAEEVLQISINNEELRGLRTVGDVHRFIATKLTPSAAVTPEPHQPEAA